MDCSVSTTDFIKSNLVSLLKRLENGYFNRAISTENRLSYNIRKFQSHTLGHKFERIKVQRLA